MQTSWILRVILSSGSAEPKLGSAYPGSTAPYSQSRWSSTSSLGVELLLRRSCPRGDFSVFGFSTRTLLDALRAPASYLSVQFVRARLICVRILDSPQPSLAYGPTSRIHSMHQDAQDWTCTACLPHVMMECYLQHACMPTASRPWSAFWGCSAGDTW